MLPSLVPNSWVLEKMELFVCTTLASNATLGSMPLVPKLGGNTAHPIIVSSELQAHYLWYGTHGICPSRETP